MLISVTELPHLFPDVVVAEEATHLPFGESATRERVVVTRQQVHAQEFNVAAVQCAAHKHTEINEMKSVTEHCLRFFILLTNLTKENIHCE